MRIKGLFAAVLCIAMLLLSACSAEYTQEYDYNDYDIGETVSIYITDSEENRDKLCATFRIDSYELTREEYVSEKLVDFRDGAPVYERTTYPYKVEINYTFTNKNGYKKTLKTYNFEINTYDTAYTEILSADNSSLTVALSTDTSFELEFSYDSEGKADAVIQIPVSFAYNTEILEDLNEQAAEFNVQAEEAAMDVMRALIIFTVSLLAVGIVGLVIFFIIYSKRQKKKRDAAPPVMPFAPPPPPPFAPMAPPAPMFTGSVPQPPAAPQTPSEPAPENTDPEIAPQSPTADNEPCNDKDFFTN